MGDLPEPPENLWGEPCACSAYTRETRDPIYDTPDDAPCPGRLTQSNRLFTFECDACQRQYTNLDDYTDVGAVCPGRYCQRCKGTL
jgi:hypothetical protein